MLVSAVQNNFASEYYRKIENEYPLDIVVFNPSEYEDFKLRDKVKLYDCYVAEDGKYHAYHLLEEKDSVFRITGLIADGKFPEGDHEILATYEFLSDYFGISSGYSDCVGKTIVFKGEEFSIAGTVETTHGSIESYLCADWNYSPLRRTENPYAIFVPYGTLKNIGEIQELELLTGVYDGIHNDEAALRAYSEACGGSAPNNFYHMIENAQQTLDRLTYLFVLVLFAVYIVSCIFMVTIVSAELFYRRRELGYLQIFGLDKKRIGKIVISEYVLKTVVSLASALVLYLAAAAVYLILCGVFPLFDPVFTALILICLAAVYLLTSGISIKTFLKKSVIELII